jgi:hypothetical protein
MTVIGLAIGILGVWRITHLLHAENGPWNAVERFRSLIGSNFWSALFGCFYCLSLWVAAPFALFLAGDSKQRLLLWPALSGGAILIERLTSPETASEPAIYSEDQYPEDEEKPDVRMYQENSSPFARSCTSAADSQLGLR